MSIDDLNGRTPDDAVRAIARALGVDQDIGNAIYQSAVRGLACDAINEHGEWRACIALIGLKALGHGELQPDEVRQRFGVFCPSWNLRSKEGS